MIWINLCDISAFVHDVINFSHYFQMEVLKTKLLQLHPDFRLWTTFQENEEFIVISQKSQKLNNLKILPAFHIFITKVRPGLLLLNLLAFNGKLLRTEGFAENADPKDTKLFQEFGSFRLCQGVQSSEESLDLIKEFMGENIVKRSIKVGHEICCSLKFVRRMKDN